MSSDKNVNEEKWKSKWSVDLRLQTRHPPHQRLRSHTQLRARPECT